MTLGNDFAGVVATVGSRHASGFTPSNAHLHVLGGDPPVEDVEIDF